MEAEKAKKMALRIDYYKVLSVDKSAGERDVKKAYRFVDSFEVPCSFCSFGPLRIMHDYDNDYASVRVCLARRGDATTLTPNRL
jgi:hypothetical protein